MEEIKKKAGRPAKDDNDKKVRLELWLTKVEALIWTKEKIYSLFRVGKVDSPVETEKVVLKPVSDVIPKNDRMAIALAAQKMSEVKVGLVKSEGFEKAPEKLFATPDRDARADKLWDSFQAIPLHRQAYVKTFISQMRSEWVNDDAVSKQLGVWQDALDRGA